MTRKKLAQFGSNADYSFSIVLEKKWFPAYALICSYPKTSTSTEGFAIPPVNNVLRTRGRKKN